MTYEYLQIQGINLRLKPGDKWCLCAMTWREALVTWKLHQKLDHEATKRSSLTIIPLEHCKTI